VNTIEIAGAELRRAGDRTLLVRLTDRAGRVGWGECSPLPGRSPDTRAECERALERVLAGPVPSIAATAAGAAGAIDVLDRALPAARFALESALLDLAAQARGVSVAQLLAAEPAARVACSAVVPPTGAAPHVPRGITTWKVKIGDLARLDRDLADLRRTPAGIHLRLDINGQWSRDDASSQLPRLAELVPEWVEEPTSATDLIALGASLPVPIALDESLCHAAADTVTALERGLVRALVLKPALLGGLAAAAVWAERARRAGAVPVVSHLFDGPIAFAACAELALALARPEDPAAGLGPHEGLSALAGVHVRQLGEDGTHLSSHRPGLGVSP
jgi:o-succinylbenzoate synthase